MSFRVEVRLSGSGGQGLALAGRILAEAAAIEGELNATQTRSYGPEARGGVSRSDVVISDGPIDYPKAARLDVLLALTQASLDAYARDLAEGGVAIADESLQAAEDTEVRVVPVLKVAREELGRAVVGNMVALGCIARHLPQLEPEWIVSALKRRVPAGTEDLNERAFLRGLEL